MHYAALFLAHPLTLPQDIAILSIPSYESPDVNVFQALVRDFIRMAKDAGKAKLVFDLRGNGGGHAMLGYDTFKQVFPRGDQSPFGGTRYRTHEALDIVGRVTEEFSAGRTYAQNNETAFHEGFAETTHHDVLLFTSAFNYDLQLDANEVEFPSWQHLLSSRTHQGDNFSKILRYNFSDTDSYAQPGFSLMGYLNNSHETKTPQPFDSENMVMVSENLNFTISEISLGH